VPPETVYNVMSSIIDFINPAVPGKVSPIDIKRSGAGPALFEALVCMQALPAAAKGTTD
jgi:hypothetical protein